jgi:hypothetical protein
MTDLARLGIHIEAHGDRLRHSPRSAVTPDVAQRMKAHKHELLDPCPAGGSLAPWESVAGNLFGATPGQWRCLRCDPPMAARRWRERAARLLLYRTAIETGLRSKELRSLKRGRFYF